MTPRSWLGRQIGNYEFVSLVGAGGMGEVYQAHDSKLKRQVAIKILTEQFARDPGRVNRFQREAELLASLNHPNIAAIYGLEEDDGFRFLILELVEGETLAERLRRGPIALNDALQIAAQIAEGLGAAHERGILHRDLKPANIKLTPGGKVKLLDFGLAKTFVGEGATVNLSDSPTIVTESMPGVVLGTAPYMSPEQANGLVLDRRTDIFAFGAVLYEMLTGERAFPGKTVGDVLAAVIRAEPDWSKLPTHTPSAIRRLLRRCLQKDRNRRLQTAGDAQLEIDEALTAPDLDTDGRLAPARMHWLWPGVAALFFAASVLLSFLYLRSSPAEPRELSQFEIPQPPNVTYSSFAVSPDGRKLAFVATVGGVARLWVRSMESVEARQLPGTDGAAGDPFWSPDSRFIVFYAQGKLQKIEAVGSPAQTLCNISFGLSGGFWTLDDRIVFANSVFANFSGNEGVFEVSSSGGAVSAVTKLAAGEYAHSYPTLLPDGRHFLYTRSQAGETAGGIYLGLLGATPEQQGANRVLPDVSKTSYVPSDSASGPVDGYVLFVRGDTLMAQPWDNQRLELVGDAIPIAERVPPNGLSATTGLLVYRRSAVDAGGQLTWFDRQGQMLSTAGEPSVFELNSPPALSPDGKRVAFARTDKSSGNTDIWLLEFAGGLNTRFTIDTGPDLNPVWSPDGRYVAFAGQRNGVWGIYQKASSNPTGVEELLYTSGNAPARPSSWSRDRRTLLFSSGSPYDIWMLPLNTGAAQGSAEHSRTLVHERFNERGARLSPDGRYYAYVSNLSGQDEIYVQTFVDPAAAGTRATEGNWKISTSGGGGVRWPGADGREILYRTASGDLMSVDVSLTTPFEVGSSRFLFKSPGSLAMPGGVGLLFWDVTPDGQRFLFAVPVGQSAAAPYTVVQNWQTLLKR